MVLVAVVEMCHGADIGRHSGDGIDTSRMVLAAVLMLVAVCHHCGLSSCGIIMVPVKVSRVRKKEKRKQHTDAGDKSTSPVP